MLDDEIVGRPGEPRRIRPAGERAPRKWRIRASRWTKRSRNGRRPSGIRRPLDVLLNVVIGAGSLHPVAFFPFSAVSLSMPVISVVALSNSPLSVFFRGGPFCSLPVSYPSARSARTKTKKCDTGTVREKNVQANPTTHSQTLSPLFRHEQTFSSHVREFAISPLP